MKKRVWTSGGEEPEVRRAKSESPPRTDGVMRPDTGSLRVPSDLSDEDNSRSLLPNKVVLVIALLALVFIAIIAWFVSRMPPK